MIHNFNDVCRYLLILFGPTGVGKTEVAQRLAEQFPAEIINSDVGQFYAPLSIGTAKPDWRSEPIAHHLFDILDKPVDFTVIAYRNRFLETAQQIWQRHKLPIVVGGSSFYINALFFPPQVETGQKELYTPNNNTAELWNRLYGIDPERAAQIHPHDTYRIKRALEIWQITGKKPSAFIPLYNPLSPYTLICLTRDRDDLYERINKRTETMIQAGWIDEVKKLRGTPWEQFLRRKKLIGYSEILDYFEGKKNLADTIALIQKETRNYAKRQLIFWRCLEKQLKKEILSPITSIETVNLTSTDLTLYIKQLSMKVKSILS